MAALSYEKIQGQMRTAVISLDEWQSLLHKHSHTEGDGETGGDEAKMKSETGFNPHS